MNATKLVGLQMSWRRGAQRARPALWHTGCNSCCAHPFTTTTTHRCYYNHYPGRAWRNRRLALLPAGVSRDRGRQSNRVTVSQLQVVRIVTSSDLCSLSPSLPLSVLPPCPCQNIVRLDNTMQCNLQMLLVKAAFINHQQAPVQILICSRLTCTEV